MRTAQPVIALLRRSDAFWRSLLASPKLLWTALLLIGVQPAFSAVSLNAEEQKMAHLLTTASGQRRDKSRMVADPRLCQVARAKAADMARRRYFSHTNPDGEGPNYLVRRAGYPLPSHYNQSKSGNNIESIGCGYNDANAAWAGWMASSGHKTHLLATESFYRDQTSFGVGYHYEAGSPYLKYFVILTAPPAGDLLTISSPASGARVTTDQVTVAGEVSGSPSVAQLQYRLENAAGMGTWQNGPVPSGSGVGPWSARVAGLHLGNNTIRVRTLNSSGALLKEAARTVRLAVMKPLLVEAGEGGAVTPGFLGSTMREVGLRYTITATPKPGYLVSHWEGLPDSPGRDVRRAAQTFEMAEGLTLRVQFIPNPFIGRNGSYQGLVIGADGTHTSTGALRLAVTQNGTFSGNLLLGQLRIPVRGRLNSGGTATVILPRPGQQSALTLILQMDLANSTGLLSATLSDGTNTTSFQVERKDAVAPAGPNTRFTFRIAPDATIPESPQGYGYGVAVVTPARIATLNVFLADGRRVTTTANVPASGQLAIYAPLFAGTGALAGQVQLSGEQMSGEVRWFKPERPLDRRHPAGFATKHQFEGGVYVPPKAGTQILAWEPGASGQLVLSSPEMSSLVQPLTIGTNNAMAMSARTIPGVRITLQPLTGIFAGGFKDAAGVPRTFRGAVSQHANAGWGHFLGATQSGAAVLQLQPQ